MSRTIQYLHRCLKTKEPLCREQYNIYTDAWKQKNICVENYTIFTQMLENKRTFVRVQKLRPYWLFSTTVEITLNVFFYFECLVKVFVSVILWRKMLLKKNEISDTISKETIFPFVINLFLSEYFPIGFWYVDNQSTLFVKFVSEFKDRPSKISPKRKNWHRFVMFLDIILKSVSTSLCQVHYYNLLCTVNENT